MTSRAARVRDTAGQWAAFWNGRLDLDALAWELAELLNELADHYARVARAGAQATHWWQQLWSDDDLLLSVPGVGPPPSRPRSARSWATAAASPRPSTRLVRRRCAVELVVRNHHAAVPGDHKEGPAALRLAFYQAANAARTVDPQLAACCRMLMVERGHCHARATIAIARKLVARTWRTITRGTPYQFRDLDGVPVTRRRASALATELSCASPVTCDSAPGPPRQRPTADA